MSVDSDAYLVRHMRAIHLMFAHTPSAANIPALNRTVAPGADARMDGGQIACLTRPVRHPSRHAASALKSPCPSSETCEVASPKSRRGR
jgi:hypothetical protein